jgi:hypothetical protein
MDASAPSTVRWFTPLRVRVATDSPVRVQATVRVETAGFVLIRVRGPHACEGSGRRYVCSVVSGRPLKFRITPLLPVGSITVSAAADGLDADATTATVVRRQHHGRDATQPLDPGAAPVEPASAGERLSSDPTVGLEVPLAGPLDHIGRDRRHRVRGTAGEARPSPEPVTQRLLVERLLRAPG